MRSIDYPIHQNIIDSILGRHFSNQAHRVDIRYNYSIERAEYIKILYLVIDHAYQPHVATEDMKL